MRKCILAASGFLIVAQLLFFTQSLGQCTTNLLLNPSFESPVQPNIGNNLTGNANFNGWTIPSGATFNIIKTNGTVYGGGPDNAQDGIQYVDITNAGGFVQQSFTLTCATTITFRGYFSRREAGGVPFNSYIEIVNVSAVVVATSNILNFTVGESQEVWKLANGTAALPAGTYVFRFYVDNYANCDAAFLCTNPDCGPLPVQLSAFSGAVEKCGVKLKWESQSEINFKAYQVEYSTNGTDFITLGTVNAANNTSTINNYEFVQPASVTGKGIYRLKMIDIDGKYKYSDRIVLNVRCNGNDVLIYPNPSKDFINVSILNPAVSYTATAKLYNVSGQLVIYKTVKNGSNKIDIKNLSAGVYYLAIADAEENKKYKIVKE
jgi:hypothetical protein